MQMAPRSASRRFCAHHLGSNTKVLKLKTYQPRLIVGKNAPKRNMVEQRRSKINGKKCEEGKREAYYIRGSILSAKTRSPGWLAASLMIG